MPRTSLPKLSKSRFVSGLQCHKRLYLESFHRDLADPISASQQAIFDTGTAIGEMAQLRYPGGVLIAHDHFHHADAVAQTAEVLADKSVPAIFEAAFTEDDVRVRADVLVRRDGGSWDLVEVKSSASWKPQHVDDLAIQLLTIERAGLRVDRCVLAHLNRDYVYAGGAHDPQELFALADLTAEVRERVVTVPGDIASMREALGGERAPDVPVGPHCTKPYPCPFTGYCHRDEPEWPISLLPRLSPKRREAFRAEGIRSIVDLPAQANLNPLQKRVREAIVSGKPYVGDDLGEHLRELVAPVHFIDFETIMPALPFYVGSRPFQTIPIQWSDHVLHENGDLEHAEFLADGTSDPHDDFARTLIDQLAGAGTVVVYSNYEETQLKRLRETAPAQADGLQAVLGLRWVDLLQVIRTTYYHADFRGSFSLKAVLPVMVPQIGYADLDIQEGVTASQVFLDTLRGEMPRSERDRLRTNLLAYCKRDTEAMVRIVEALRAKVAAGE